jgi:predicted PurR-regulated permease PerM
MPQFDSDKLKQFYALSAIIILGAFLFYSLFDYIPAFLGAVIFYVICQPFLKYLTVKKRINKTFSIIIILISTFLVILIPVLGVSYLLVSKIINMLSVQKDIFSQIQSFTDILNSKLGFNLLSHDNLTKLESSIAQVIPGLLGETFNVLANIVIMYFILFFMLYSESDMEKSIYNVLPYQVRNANMLTNELISQTYSNVIGTPLLALSQGILATFGFWIFGLKDPIFWGIMCGMFSFLPLAGTPLIWIPAGIIQFSSGAQWLGIAIFIYGLVVIVGFDNIFRLVVQKKMAQVHPLITLFGIIFGARWFGLPGFIFGPLLISYFLIAFKIYKIEYNQNKKDEEQLKSNISEIKKTAEKIKSEKTDNKKLKTVNTPAIKTTTKTIRRRQKDDSGNL